ncbi:MAG: DUF3047 domain-containing protein [Mariprofundaceae bacterium]
MLRCIITLMMLFFVPAMAHSSTVMIGQFSKTQLDGWKHKKFNGQTLYTLVTDSRLKTQVLQAVSLASASGLFFEKKINLEKTPYLHWSWKADRAFKVINENKKEGDDFIARIYVVIDGGIFFWKTRALSYVWSSSHQKFESWDNPYTSNTKMYAVDSGSINIGSWQYYKRNIRDDLRELFGDDLKSIDAIAIMTDTDNSEQAATSFYGDIYFTAD